MKYLSAGILILFFCTFFSCKKNTTTGTANLIFKFKFDSTQVRLNNLGAVAPMAAGHAGQSPRFNTMSAHYVELAPNQFTALGAGNVLYKRLKLQLAVLPQLNFQNQLLLATTNSF